MSTIEQFEKYLGMKKEEAMEGLRVTHKNIRAMGPDDVGTMDMRMDRVNIDFGHDGLVKRVWVG